MDEDQCETGATQLPQPADDVMKTGKAEEPGENDDDDEEDDQPNDLKGKRPTKADGSPLTRYLAKLYKDVYAERLMELDPGFKGANQKELAFWRNGIVEDVLESEEFLTMGLDEGTGRTVGIQVYVARNQYNLSFRPANFEVVRE
jgi:hypothetical protein